MDSESNLLVDQGLWIQLFVLYCSYAKAAPLFYFNLEEL